MRAANQSDGKHRPYPRIVHYPQCGEIEGRFLTPTGSEVRYALHLIEHEVSVLP
jgi:predicted metal-binding protein